jgi:hypothetical protein
MTEGPALNLNKGAPPTPLTKEIWTAARKPAYYSVSPMATATTMTFAPSAEPQKGEPGATDMLSCFALEASAERIKPGQGVLWGLFLGGGLWIGIFALIFWFKV